MCLLRRNLRLAYAQRPHASLCSLQLLQQLAVVLVEVVAQNHLRLWLALGHGHRTTAEDGDPGHGLHLEHGVEHGGTDEPSGAGEDEMHFGGDGRWKLRSKNLFLYGEPVQERKKKEEGSVGYKTGDFAASYDDRCRGGVDGDLRLLVLVHNHGRTKSFGGSKGTRSALKKSKVKTPSRVSELHSSGPGADGRDLCLSYFFGAWSYVGCACAHHFLFSDQL